MMKKHPWKTDLCCLAAAALAVFLFGWPVFVPESAVAGKCYVYQGEGFGGDFTITVNEDHTFTYYEGLLSSHIGRGTWRLWGDTLILSEDEETGYGFVNTFRVEENALYFQMDDASNFLHVSLFDEACFLAEEG